MIDTGTAFQRYVFQGRSEDELAQFRSEIYDPLLQTITSHFNKGRNKAAQKLRQSVMEAGNAGKDQFHDYLARRTRSKGATMATSVCTPAIDRAASSTLGVRSRL